MFLWVALKINDAFAYNLRKKCVELNKSINLSMQALSLPAHISLKITFDIKENDKQTLIDTIKKVVKPYLPMSVKTSCIEKVNNIIWVKFKDNDQLTSLHNALDETLYKYGILQHEFDKNFIFHSTLFIDENINLIDTMYEIIKDEDVSDTLILDTLLIGESSDGINFVPIVCEKL